MENDASLVGKTAIVTGASSGIGRASAEALGDSGVNVVLVARREAKLEKLAHSISSESRGTAIAVPTDVTDESQVREAVTLAVDHFDGLDIIVNNAGIGKPGEVEDITIEDYHQIMRVNIDGAFYTTRSAASHLRDANGTLIFIGSYAAKFPYPNNPVYAGTKWWIRGFALSMAGALGEDGVAVTVINPSEVRTEFASEYDEPYESQYEKGKVTEPEDVADCVLFACQRRPPNAITEMDLFRRGKFHQLSDVGSM